MKNILEDIKRTIMIENLGFLQLIETVFSSEENKEKKLRGNEVIELLFEMYWNSENIWFKNKWKEFRQLDGNHMMFDLKSGFRKFKSLLQKELEDDYAAELEEYGIVFERNEDVVSFAFLDTMNAINKKESLKNLLNPFSLNVMENSEPFNLQNIETNIQEEDKFVGNTSPTMDTFIEMGYDQNDVQEFNNFIDKPQELKLTPGLTHQGMSNISCITKDLTAENEVIEETDEEVFDTILSNHEILEDVVEEPYFKPIEPLGIQNEVSKENIQKINIMDEIFDDYDNLVDVQEFEDEVILISNSNVSLLSLDDLQLPSKQIFEEVVSEIDESEPFIVENKNETPNRNLIIDEIDEIDTVSVILEDGDVVDYNIENTYPPEEDIEIKNKELPLNVMNQNNNSYDNVFLGQIYSIVKPNLAQALDNFGIKLDEYNRPTLKSNEKYDSHVNETNVEEIPFSDFEETVKTESITRVKEEDFEIVELVDYKENNLVESIDELLPYFAEYIYKNKPFNVHSMNIKSSNNWNQPVMVGISGLTNGENYVFNEFLDNTIETSLKIYSFNFIVKIDIENIREAFFQTLSNSNWANEGYLVFQSIDETNKKQLKQEMKRLSAFYGIGTIMLNINDLEETEVVSLAEGRDKIDFNFINEIVSNQENVDFNQFIKSINEAKKTNDVNLNLFNKIY